MLSAEHLLELSTDGHIPPAARARARAIDAAAPRRVSLVRIGAVRMKTDTMIDLMAQTIVQRWAASGTVTEADFEQLGLTRAQMYEHRAAAFARATAQDPRIAAMASQDAAA